jgi:hypothetical protein
MRPSQIEKYAVLLTGIWAVLKILTFLIPPLLRWSRIPLHILFLFAACFCLLSIFAEREKKRRKAEILNRQQKQS